MITKWKKTVGGMKDSFGRKGKKDSGLKTAVKTLDAKLGELVAARNFLVKAFEQ